MYGSAAMAAFVFAYKCCQMCTIPQRFSAWDGRPSDGGTWADETCFSWLCDYSSDHDDGLTQHANGCHLRARICASINTHTGMHARQAHGQHSSLRGVKKPKKKIAIEK